MVAGRRRVTRRGWAVVVAIALAAVALLVVGLVELQARSSAADPPPTPPPATPSPTPEPTPTARPQRHDPAQLSDGCAEQPAQDVVVAGTADNAVATAVWRCTDRVLVAPRAEPALVAVAAPWAAGVGAALLLEEADGNVPGLDGLDPTDVQRIRDTDHTAAALQAVAEVGGSHLVVAHAHDPEALAVGSALASATGRLLLPAAVPAPATTWQAIADADDVVLVGADGTGAHDLAALLDDLGHLDPTTWVRGETAAELLAAVATEAAGLRRDLDVVSSRPRRPWIVPVPSPARPLDPVLVAAAGATAASAAMDLVPADVADLRSTDPASSELPALLLDSVTVPVGEPAWRHRGRAIVSLPADGATGAAASAVVAAEDVGWQLDVLANGLQVPGGGQVLFPHRRFVALYGHANHGSLGVFGEQPPEEAVARALAVAEGYDADGIPTVPAFDLITTLASASATPDGDYSAPMPLEQVRAIHEVARANGVYLVLDLQPGRTDFLTQAKMYEELLREPDVGLALDPEWRLKPNQVHLRQIGSVDAAEVNQVIDWLAEIVREEALPQKLLIVHQFRFSMITNRETIRTPDELAVMIHMDGQGGLASKYDTYDALIDPGQPWWPGWKNFYDEDHPMATPEQVLALEPTPWFVSFQ